MTIHQHNMGLLNFILLFCGLTIGFVVIYSSRNRFLFPIPASLYQSKKLEPVVHFRELFNKTFSSSNDIDIDMTGADNVSSGASASAKYLIYRCDTDSMKICGGWADRIKGMMTAYVIANLTGRIFKVQMPLPSCDIKRFIVPNKVNWSLPVPFHKFVNVSRDIQKLDYVDNMDFLYRVKHVDFHSLPEMKAKYIYFKSNLDFMNQFKASTRYRKQLSWMKGLTVDQINALVFKRLFKLSPRLHRKLNAFLTNNLEHGEQLICAHVRMGKNPSLPHDTEQRASKEDVPKVWDFLRNFTNTEPSHKIFLMSDSASVISDSKRQSFKDKLILTSGNVVHVEASRGISDEEMCVGLDKVLLEHFILMHCDTLLISKSGLSCMSAYVRGSDKGLYCLLTQGRIVPCRRSTLKKLYGIKG